MADQSLSDDIVHALVAQLEAELGRERSGNQAIGLETAELNARREGRIEGIALALAEVFGRVAASHEDLERIVPAISLAAERLCVADGSSLSFFDESDVCAWDGDQGFHRLAKAVLEAELAERGLNFSSAAVARNEPLEVVGPVEQWEHQFPGAARRHRASGRTEISAIAEPVRESERAIGALVVFRKQAMPFNGAERAVLKALAGGASVAIKNARLYKDRKNVRQ